MGFISGIVDILFPGRCIFCHKFLSGSEKKICHRCEQGLPYVGEDELINGEFFSGCASPLYYDGHVRESILRFKFKGRDEYAGYYGRLIADCVRRDLSGKYDIITWVPLSRERKKSRGYDQAMLICMAAALELDDVAVELLKKVVDAPAQSSLGESERRANILGAYEAADEELIEGRRVLLVDDVVTTGSTLSECARVLLDAGAVSVVCAALARTRQDRH